MQRIALLGLGNMGLSVATRLVAQGYAVLGYDMSDDAQGRAAAAGVAVCLSVQDAVQGSDVVVLSLPTPAVVRSAMPEVARHLRSGQCVLDLGTNDPGTAQAMASVVGAAGGHYLDAPVSGGPSRAATGELTLMVGGDAQAVADLNPLLTCMGKQVEHVGAAGAGCIAKLLNNYVALWNMAGVSQAFVAAQALGLSVDRLHDVMCRSSGQSYALNRNFPKIRSGDFTPNFSLNLAQKDLRLALDLMQDAGLTCLAETELRGLFDRAVRAGGERDVAAIYDTLQALP